MIAESFRQRRQGCRSAALLRMDAQRADRKLGATLPAQPRPLMLAVRLRYDLGMTMAALNNYITTKQQAKK